MITTSKIQEAALKAEDLMTQRYGNSWLIELENGNLEIKEGYESEYDYYFDKFMYGIK